MLPMLTVSVDPAGVPAGMEELNVVSAGSVTMTWTLETGSVPGLRTVTTKSVLPPSATVQLAGPVTPTPISRSVIVNMEGAQAPPEKMPVSAVNGLGIVASYESVVRL